MTVRPGARARDVEEGAARRADGFLSGWSVRLRRLYARLMSTALDARPTSRIW